MEVSLIHHTVSLKKIKKNHINWYRKVFSQKYKYCMILLIQGTHSRQIHRHRKNNKWMVSPIIKDWGKQGNDSCLMCIEFHFCKEKTSGNGGGDGCTTAWRHLMILNCTLTIVKIVSCMSWFLTIILKTYYIYTYTFSFLLVVL